MVGAIPDLTWDEAEEQLGEGDEVVMFTDGVPDARRAGGPMFGEARLVELLGELVGAPVTEVCTRIIARLDEHATRDWPDDVTLLVLRRNEPGTK